jgi:signal transduction histidine kinase
MQEKILIVDDREDNLLSIETILEKSGYLFVRALSGKQALKTLLNEHDFALILMDVKMPLMNGFETATMIYQREKLRNIPIIFITAHNYDEDNIFKGYLAGAVDYIYKPINPDLLRAKVSVFVELYKKNRTLMIQEQKLTAINRSLENEINERMLSEEKVKSLNLQLLQNIDRLEAANKDLERFAFMASHDLQEPLRKIMIFCDRLRNQVNLSIDQDGAYAVKKIEQSANRLSLLIKDILTFSKISEEEKIFIKSDMNLLVKEVVGEMESDILEKNAEITIEPLPGIVVNPVLIRPLFHNLISNALKYAKKNIPPKVRIYAELNSLQPRNKYCRIYVIDNGIGFEQRYAESIFGMFKRLHNKSEYEGTGIGLALCKKIVEEHKGYISALSKENEGSTFIITLPLLEERTKKKELLKQAIE